MMVSVTVSVTTRLYMIGMLFHTFRISRRRLTAASSMRYLVFSLPTRRRSLRGVNAKSAERQKNAGGAVRIRGETNWVECSFSERILVFPMAAALVPCPPQQILRYVIALQMSVLSNGEDVALQHLARCPYYRGREHAFGIV